MLLSGNLCEKCPQIRVIYHLFKRVLLYRDNKVGH
jgi:hypothetical protein